VDEDSEFGVLEPTGHRTAIERLESGLITRLGSQNRWENEQCKGMKDTFHGKFE
jgi:hypothetical protein